MTPPPFSKPLSGIEGNLADEGIELLMEITNGGNTDSQNTLADHIKLVDRDGKARPCDCISTNFLS